MPKAPKKGTRAGAAKPQAVNVVLTERESCPEIYANHVEVSHNVHEFEMSFARLPAAMSVDRQDEIMRTGAIEIEALVRVVFPPSLLSDMIKVLHAQADKYAANVGALPDTSAKGEKP